MKPSELLFNKPLIILELSYKPSRWLYTLFVDDVLWGQSLFRKPRCLVTSSLVSGMLIPWVVVCVRILIVCVSVPRGQRINTTQDGLTNPFLRKQNHRLVLKLIMEVRIHFHSSCFRKKKCFPTLYFWLIVYLDFHYKYDFISCYIEQSHIVHVISESKWRILNKSIYI
jgi:hypothetical protein